MKIWGNLEVTKISNKDKVESKSNGMPSKGFKYVKISEVFFE